MARGNRRQGRALRLTFHHGSLPSARRSRPAPPRPKRSPDAVLGNYGMDAYVWDLRASSPPAVREWLAVPAMLRLIGPHYDARDDAAHHLSDGSLADWFDVLVHVRPGPSSP
ncbi:erythromycin esterase family protein [Streptomyces sp. NPDC017529]|uniref:erythromycin esterase family protein n=1 Tax=Streptomyces sp. NPDC017529 TaxID=3365000 RepID=UPI003795CA67